MDSSKIKQDSKFQKLVEELLQYAASPTEQGSKTCKELISIMESHGVDGELKVFLDSAYQLLRPFKNGPSEIVKLIESYVGVMNETELATSKRSKDEW
jgi:hypothetical protein